MRNCYENILSNQIEKQKRYFYGAILDTLYKFEEGYPFLDNRIQNLINQIKGSNDIFGHQPQVLTICALLQTAREDHSQLRSCVLNAINLVDELKGGDCHV
jgi:hypothetical protein